MRTLRGCAVGLVWLATALFGAAHDGKPALDRVKEELAKTDSDDAAPHFKLAQELARNGKSEEALKELVWCWDEGKKDPDFARLRPAQVARELGILARTYPQAKEILVARRDQSRERVLAGKGGDNAVQELIALNNGLGAKDDSLAVFDQLPAGDPRRRTMSIFLFESLVEKKRYADALLFARLESDKMMIEQSKNRLTDDSSRQMMALMLARRIGLSIEAYAGSGRLDEARQLLQKFLELDGSEVTKAVLRTNLERAGHVELLPADAPAAAVAPKT